MFIPCIAVLHVKANTVHWVTSIYVYFYAASTCSGTYVPSSGSVFVLVSYVKTETASGNVNCVICVPVLWCCTEQHHKTGTPHSKKLILTWPSAQCWFLHVIYIYPPRFCRKLNSRSCVARRNIQEWRKRRQWNPIRLTNNSRSNNSQTIRSWRCRDAH
jgi:hypothetical protein